MKQNEDSHPRLVGKSRRDSQTHHGEVYSILLSPGKWAARMVTL
jgi:hypothetical protein